MTFWRRACGLIALSPAKTANSSRILVFPHCRSVHTWFMAVPIDIAFVDATGRVLRCCRGVSPWCVRFCAQADFVIERYTPCG